MFKIKLIAYVIALTLFLPLTSQSSYATNGPGFSHGDRFEAHTLLGSITVQCPQSRAMYNCQDYYLSPAMRDVFIYLDAPESDSVKLTSIQSSGRERSRTQGFDGQQSTSDFNLWISTLFQRPLLGVGNNRVIYEMISNGSVVEDGEFDVYVELMPTRYCPHRFYYSGNENDCRAGGALFCSRYFRDVRSCR